MARRKTIFIPNNTYYITFTILGWQKIFTSDEYCRSVYKWFDFAKEKYDNDIRGYVIMPDHIHVLMYITEKSPRLSILVMNAERFIAYDIVKLLKHDKRQELLEYFNVFARTRFRAHHRIFTNGYDSLLIETRKFFLQKLNYIHDNPVRAGLVKEPEDYRYSSAANYATGKGYYAINIIDF
jgi:putative transposase